MLFFGKYLRSHPALVPMSSFKRLRRVKGSIQDAKRRWEAEEQTFDQAAIKLPLVKGGNSQSRRKPAARDDNENDDDLERLEELHLKMAIEASLAEVKKTGLSEKPLSRSRNSGEVSALARPQQQVKRSRRRLEAVVQCFGCGGELQVPSPQADPTEREGRVILGCGHVVGSNCLTWRIAAARAESEEPTCPHCLQEIVTGVV